MKESDENEEIDAEWKSLVSLNEAAATVKAVCPYGTKPCIPNFAQIRWDTFVR